MPSNLINQLINGHRYDFSSIELTLLPGKIFTNVQEITYSQTLEPGILRGTSPHKLGRTRGQYDAEGSLTMYKEDWAEFIRLIRVDPQNVTQGFMEASFLVTIIYQELKSGAINTDILRGCRITSVENSHSEGTDALTVSADLDIMKVIENGNQAVFDNTGRP